LGDHQSEKSEGPRCRGTVRTGPGEGRINKQESRTTMGREGSGNERRISGRGGGGEKSPKNKIGANVLSKKRTNADFQKQTTKRNTLGQPRIS